MLVLSAGRLAGDAVKKSKQRKKITYQRVLEKAATERQAVEQLRQDKQEALKSIAINYVEIQKKAKQEQALQEKKETETKIAIAAGIGLVMITVGYVVYIKIK